METSLSLPSQTPDLAQQQKAIPSASEVGQAIASVEAALRSLGQDPAPARSSDSAKPSWIVQAGPLQILISIDPLDSEGAVRWVCPLLLMPTRDLLPFYRKLLEINLRLTGATLGLSKDVVYLVNSHPHAGLTPTEIRAAIQQIGGYGEALVEVLIAEFSGASLWRPT